MLKDKYTTQTLLDASPLTEKDKVIVSTDTYALLDAKDEQNEMLALMLEKIRLGTVD